MGVRAKVFESLCPTKDLTKKNVKALCGDILTPAPHSLWAISRKRKATSRVAKSVVQCFMLFMKDKNLFPAARKVVCDFPDVADMLDIKSLLDFLQPAVFDNDNENLRSSAYCKATKFNRVKTKFNPVEIKSKSLETQSKSLEDESSRLLDFFSTELDYFSTELDSFSRLSDKNIRITLHF